MGSDGAAGNETANSTERMMKTIIGYLIALVTMFAMPMAMAQSAMLKAGDGGVMFVL